ncbi:MAG: TIGR00730 family Rossman fold protein [Muribaculaceae bacterium]|nr:TIGR00730 family Rossman fold protein [Muribaculaceae bacterium]MDE5844686.1 TIGR00730 family Rossman fold protein [Muribaculaceae bacterium]
MNKSIVVYCASSSKIDEAFLSSARELGRLMALKEVTLIDGGGQTGLMGAVNDGCIEAGGLAIGVIPRFMDDRGWAHSGLSHKIVAEDMHNRKKTMADMADGAIALPGGVGTFEELLEIITWRKLNLFHGNVVIFNDKGYYDPLLEMLDKAARLGFTKPGEKLFDVAYSVDEALNKALGQ